MARTVVFVLVIALSASVASYSETAEPTPTQDREITNVGSEGVQMSWRVTLERLQLASKWNSESEPRLSVGQAVAKGRDYLRSQGRPNQLAITNVELRHVNGAPPQCFAYVLQFGDALTEGTVVLLLDGSVVSPITTHPGPVKAAEFSPFDKPVVDFMKHAQTVYVFPVKSEPATRPNDKELRLLDAEGQKALLTVLSNEANWYHGLMTVGIVYPPGSIGFVFRAQNDELLLFVASDCVAGCTVEGTFKGKDILGMLNECAQPAMDSWKQRYASIETHK